MIQRRWSWFGAVLLALFAALLLLMLSGCSQDPSRSGESRIFSMRGTASKKIEPVDPSRIWTEPSIRRLPFTLNGHRRSVSITVYHGLQEYLASLPRVLSYDTPPTLATDFKGDWLRHVVNQPQQHDGLRELITEIRKLTPSDDERARIAISLVQNIPFDTAHYERRLNMAGTRFPYEVLYDNAGVCSEKTLLLACILKEFGFGAAVMDFEEEMHRVLGLRCPPGYGYYGGEYCFIESTGPQIPTDALGTYSGQQLHSRPDIVTLYDGKEFATVARDAEDARLWQTLRSRDQLTRREYHDWLNLARKYGLFTPAILDSLTRATQRR